LPSSTLFYFYSGPQIFDWDLDRLKGVVSLGPHQQNVRQDILFSFHQFIFENLWQIYSHWHLKISFQTKGSKNNNQEVFFLCIHFSFLKIFNGCIAREMEEKKGGSVY
jgi:hypothetical protein